MMGSRSKGSLVALTRFMNPIFAVFAAEQISYRKNRATVLTVNSFH